MSDRSESAIEWLRAKVQAVCVSLEREGCTHSGCDRHTNWHSMCCPLGPASKLYTLLEVLQSLGQDADAEQLDTALAALEARDE